MTPQRALRHQLYHRLAAGRDEAMRRGAVFTYTPDMQPGSWVLSSEEMREKNIPLQDYPGVIPLANGHWLLWRRYQAPPSALRGAVWVAAACGAQGWFPWHYQPKLPAQFLPDERIPELPTEPYPAGAAHVGGAATRIWQEYSDALRELQSVEPILLRCRADGFPRVETADTWLVAEPLRVLDGPGHVLVLVNVDVGRWPGYPVLDWRTQNLDVDREGRLTGYTPLTEPREVTFNIRHAADEQVVVLAAAGLERGVALTGEPTGVGSLHAYRLRIAPGSGALVYVGPGQAWKPLLEPLPTP